MIAFVGPASSGAFGQPSFDYLYIKANEGGSSGGHAAIRFGPNVYHFKNRDTLLILDRERSSEFFFSYAILNNRSIHVSQIGVDEEVEKRLAGRFLDRYRAQEAQLAILDALREDRRLLESADSLSFAVPGYGYFAPEGIPDAEDSPTLRALREKITARHGAGFLDARRRALLEAMEALAREDPAAWPTPLPDSAYDHPPFAQPWSSQLRDLAAGLAALDVLVEARALDPSTVNAPKSEDFRLDAAECAALARYADRMAEELVVLADSLRDDWGQTLLVGMARLAALDVSLENGSFVFLDTYPDEHGTIDADTLRRRSELVPLISSETREQLQASRRYFVRLEDPGELAWERVEERLVRHHELIRATRGESDLRLARGHLVPERRALYRTPVLRLRAGVAANEDLARVRARERDYAARLRKLHRYGLITHNCATAIFDTVNDEFYGSAERAQTALGGVVGDDTSLAFIPFVSADQVNARYRLLGRYTLPSYRQARLQEMREHESPLWLALSESNTLTAKTYRRGDRDSFFVFFTEDAVWLRPLFGAVNLVAGLGEAIWGLLTLPVDRGQTLVSGLKGTFMSLPELAFANIRKGSNDWVAPEHRRLKPQPAP